MCFLKGSRQNFNFVFLSFLICFRLKLKPKKKKKSLLLATDEYIMLEWIKKRGIFLLTNLQN